MTINCTLLKIYIQVVSNLLNNFQLILKVDILWPKCSNYALMLKKKCGAVNTVTKNSYNFTSINCTLLKIYIQIVSNPLNNFQLILKVDLLWPKSSNYALKLKKKCSAVNTVTKNSYNFISINCTLLKIYMQIVSNPLNNFQLILKVNLLWPKSSNYALKLKKYATISIVRKSFITSWPLTVPCWKSIYK